MSFVVARAAALRGSVPRLLQGDEMLVTSETSACDCLEGEVSSVKLWLTMEGSDCLTGDTRCLARGGSRSSLKPI